MDPRIWRKLGGGGVIPPEIPIFYMAHLAVIKMPLITTDVIIGELDKRFEQRTLTIPRRTEKLLLSAAYWTEESDLPIDDEVLTFIRTRSTVPYMVKCAEECQSLKAVTTIRTVANIITSSLIDIWLFSEVVRLLRIFTMVPVSTASTERPFSSIRQLETRNRQYRLNFSGKRICLCD